MERQVYDEMRRVQDWHWWYVARRQILAAEISTLDLPAQARILEVGCGPGGNLATLGRFGEVSALEPDAEARSYAAQTSNAQVIAGSLPLSEAPATQFDLVAAFDVLEHIADDHAAAVGLRELTRPGGYVMATVPAYPWMWSGHDVEHHHHRRYTRRQFAAVLEGAGLKLRRTSHFNTALFPVIAAVRLASKLAAPTRSTGAGEPWRPVNTMLTGIFAAERHALRFADLPFGISILAVAQRV